MRVLLISHTCQSRTEGQPKAHYLGQTPGLELRVLVPNRWKHYGHWRQADPPLSDSFQYEPARVRLPWVGPAQFYLHYYPDLARTLRDFKPDVIDLWEEPWGLVSAQACRLRNRLLPSAVVISETEQNINKRLPLPFERFRAFTLRHADFAVGRNAESIDVIRAKGYSGPAEVVPNAVDAELFHPMNRDECRRALGSHGFVVGYVGRLVEEKGLADLVDALTTCAPHVNVVFVGDGPFRPQLEQRAREHGLESRVRFLKGRALQELPSLMNAFDALALPSRTTASWKEQFGRVIIEAHACGIPVIGSTSGAIPDVIGEGGLVAREADPAELAAAINRVANSPSMAVAMGQAGRRQVEEKYTWRRVAETMADIYRRAVAAGRRHQRPSPKPEQVPA